MKIEADERTSLDLTSKKSIYCVRSGYYGVLVLSWAQAVKYKAGPESSDGVVSSLQVSGLYR